MTRRTPLASYFLIAFGVAWAGVFLVAVRTGLPTREETPDATRFLVFVAMLAGPTSASLGLTAVLGGASGLWRLAAGFGRWRVGLKPYGALLIAPGILVLTLGGLSLASPTYLPKILRAGSPGREIAVALVAGLGAGLFEELGWTGFATPRLLERCRWPCAGLLLGLTWAAWHGLADYWGGSAYGSLWGLHFLEWVVALTAFRMLMTWVYARARSLLIGVLLHASFTGSQALLWPAARPADELVWYGFFACGLWLALAFLAVRSGWLASCRASRDERQRAMRGDALIPEPMYSVTHAVSIGAPAASVWPWLAQMGADRAGWYSWDRIDNGGRASARRILPDHQQLAPGDVVPAVPGASDAFVVASVEPPRDLVLTVPGMDAGPVVVWEHLVEPLAAGRTRLVVRGRVSRGWKRLAQRAGKPGTRPLPIERVYRVLGRMPAPLLLAVAGVGHRVMEARHLRGIKQRAEQESGTASMSMTDEVTEL